MGIGEFIANNCPQTAVYWGNPVSDQEGGYTFDSPIEIACRWEEMEQVVSGKDGNSISSRALVFVLQDLDEEGMLFLGTLDDLDSDQEHDPKSIEGINYIKRFQKTPALNSTTVFLRKAYLTPSLSFGGF
jgi:hypothetical protein